MLDVTKLQEKNNLAKELVEKGLASDINEAYNQIEAKNLTGDNDGFLVGNKSVEQMEPEPEKPKVVEVAQNSDSSAELQKLSDKIEKVNNFFMQYMQNNDNNLREVDQRLRQINDMLENIPKEQTLKIEPSKEVPPVEKQETVVEKEPEMDPGEFAVDKIFDNSHGKLDKKA